MIKVDISRLCTELKPAILGAFSAEDGDDVVIVHEDDIKKVKQALEKALPADDYVVAENTEDPEELAVLKKGDLEQLRDRKSVV